MNRWLSLDVARGEKTDFSQRRKGRKEKTEGKEIGEPNCVSSRVKAFAEEPGGSRRSARPILLLSSLVFSLRSLRLCEKSVFSPRTASRLLGPRFTVLLVCLLFSIAPSLFAQDDDPEEVRIPVVGRPAEFYGGIGTGVKVSATIDPPKVTTDQWATFQLTVRNLRNAEHVEKPKLSKLDEFAKLFQVDDQPLDPAWSPQESDQRIFIYRLRPRSTAVTAVPPFTYRYFDPKLPIFDSKPDIRFPSTWTKSIPITVVKPADPPPQPAVPLSVPVFAERIPDPSKLLERGESCRGSWLGILAIVVIPPLVAIGWLVAWRRIYPDRARLARLLRSRAARKAWSALDSARDSESIAEALLQYLRTRFDLPLGAITPHEVAQQLPHAGVEPSHVNSVTSLLQRCDAARYGCIAEESVAEFARETSLLISELEGDG